MEKLILITNDDGYRARGIQILIDIARKFGHVVVVAPEKSWSGKSHSVTLDNPIYVNTLENFYSQDVEAYVTTGTPIDCVKFALNNILTRKPDLILSGINHGPNYSINSYYSGTVGAALEGAFNGINSMALSYEAFDPNANMSLAIEHTNILIEEVLSGQREDDETLCLNVNFPDIEPTESKGFKITRLAHAVWKEEFVERTHPGRPQKYYWLTGNFFNFEPDAQDTDLWAIKNNYTAIVPLTIDLTDYKTIKKLKNKGLTIKNKKQL